MIIHMARLRVLGRREDLRRALVALQELGTLHLIAAGADARITPHPVERVERCRRRAVDRALADVEEALATFGRLGLVVPRDDGGAVELPRAARRAARVRARTAVLEGRRRALEDEAATLRVYAPLVDDLEDLVRGPIGKRRFSAYLLRLRGGEAATEALRGALERVLAGACALRSRPLPGGEVALLLLTAAEQAHEVDRILTSARVDPAALPAPLAAASVADGLPRVRARQAEIERELSAVASATRAFAGDGAELVRARRALHDERLRLEACAQVGETARSFVIEGWLPARAVADATVHLRQALGPASVVEVVDRDAWRGAEAPVVLANPPWFAPFERLTAMLPLPRYGTIDATPFVAVFFPLLFGVVVGDVGYGLLLGLIAALLWRRGPRRGVARDLGRIAAAVAAYTVAFGVLYGELFGDLGRRLLGLHALWFDREEALVPFLALAIAIGLAHVVLGLVVAAIARRRHPREVAGRGLTALMLLLVAVAILAVLEYLPGSLFTPAVVTLLVAFPVLVAVEGFSALLELVTTLGHVLSYARVMALGTASVMLAVVANQMVGAFGGAVVGVLFALLFHLVNFAITIFSPTVQVLRLHYVEFFGTFFSPGGSQYRPFTRWAAQEAP